jgi:hypothetical protein
MSRSIKDNTRNSFKQVLNNASLMGLHKNKKFLEKLFDKGILTIGGAARSNNTKVKLGFFKILDLFEEKYKGQADLGFYEVGLKQFTPYFKVLYPKFTITNSRGRSHEIRDLFVYHSFQFSNGSVHPYELEGGRFSKTDLEILSSYQQSHLGSHASWADNPFYCSRFCVGGDTDVSRMLAEFEMEMDIDRYELFLFCVDSMITWESLEGVPYIKMESIENANSKMVTLSDPGCEMTIVNKIMDDKIPLDVDFYVSDGIYRIHPNLRASDFIKKIVLARYQFNVAKNILVSRVPNTYNKFQQMKVEGEVAQRMNKITVPDYTIFRGKKVYPKIIREDARKQAPTSIEDYIVYPKFLENVITKLESRIYEKAVVKSATKLYHTSNNASGGITSDTVSVQINF